MESFVTIYKLVT